MCIQLTGDIDYIILNCFCCVQTQGLVAPDGVLNEEDGHDPPGGHMPLYTQVN